MKEVILLDICYPASFTGYSHQVVAVPLWETIDRRNMSFRLADAVLEMDEIPQDERNLYGGYVRQLKTRGSEIFHEMDDVPDHGDPVYAYFSIKETDLYENFKLGENLMDCTDGKLDEILKFGQSIKDESLLSCLENLQRYMDSYRKMYPNVVLVTRIMTDFAPYSLSFSRTVDDKFVGNGGIIFHGSHDHGGDGSAPTYSVCLTPTYGWQIHT